VAFVLLVQLVVKRGEEERAATLMGELAVETRKEPGCQLFIPSRDPENPAAFVIYEQYDTRADWEAHRGTAHFERLARNGFFPLLESIERSFYETV
jgi:quinol monooxygenase YgiN